MFVPLGPFSQVYALYLTRRAVKTNVTQPFKHHWMQILCDTQLRAPCRPREMQGQAYKQLRPAMAAQWLKLASALARDSFKRVRD